MAIEKKIVVGVDTSDGQKNIESLNKTITDLNSEQNKLKQTVNDLNKEFKNSKGDIDAQAESNRKLSLAQTELNSNSIKLRDAKKELNSEIKNSENANKPLLAQLSSMPGITGSAAQSIKGFGQSLKVLAANPVGAIIMVIVGAVTLLYNIFKSFQPLVDKVEQGFAGLAAVGNVIKNLFIGLFSGTKSLSESFNGLGDSMGYAAKKATELKKAEQDLEGQQRVQSVLNAQQKNEIDQLIIQSKDRTKTEEERIAKKKEAMDKEKSMTEENLKLANKEVNIAFETLALKAGATEKEIEQLKKKNAKQKQLYIEHLNDTSVVTDEEAKTFSEALIKREGIFGTSIAFQEKQQAQTNALDDKAQAKKEKVQADAIAAEEKRKARIEKNQTEEISAANRVLALKKAQQKELETATLIDDNTYNNRIDAAKKFSEEEIAIFDKELKYKKITKSEYDLKKLESEKNVQKTISSLSVTRIDELNKQMEFDIKIAKLTEDIKIDNKKKSIKELNDLEVKRIETDRKNKEVELQLELTAKGITVTKQKEINDQLLLLNTQAKADTAKVNADYTANQFQIDEQNRYDDISNQLSAMNELNVAKFDLMSQQADMDKEKELSDVELTEEQKSNIEARYSKIKKDLALQESQFKLGQMVTLANSVGALFGKQTIVAKTAASISTTIETIRGAQAAIASMAGAGPIGWAIGAIQAGTIIASGVKGVNDIWKADGKSAASSPSVSNVVPPQIQAVAQQTTSTETKLSQTSQKVYVVESDITSIQNKVKVVENESTF